MDTPSHFFNDSIDLEGPGPYQSPERDMMDVTGDILSFPHEYPKLGFDGGPPSPDGRSLEPRMEVWESFAEQFAPMTSDQKPLFADQGLYDGESENDGIKSQMQVLSMEASRPTMRRTSSSTKSTSQRTTKSESASTDITPPDQEPPKKQRKIRKIKKEAAGEDGHKRNKFLERNRIAASKCREKKKQYVSDLEETKIGLETQHAHLQMEFNGLLGEVSGLKHHLMAHAKCNDPNIDRWLNNEARRFVQTPNGLIGQPFGPLGQATPTAVSSDSPRSRNPSIASTYQVLQGVQFEGIVPGERQGSISYPASEYPGPHCEVTAAQLSGPNLYASPADTAFPCLNSPHPKMEPEINYNHMPDNMFSPEPSTFAGG